MNVQRIYLKVPPNSKKMSEHFVIQMDKLPKKTSGERLPCAVCVIHVTQQLYPSPTNAARPGYIRCETHKMRCVSCRGSVSEDSHLSCMNCWLVEKVSVGSLLIKSAETWLTTKCPKGIRHSEKDACSCLRCKKMLVTTVEALALEEGQAGRLSPPTSCESPHVAISFALG